MPVVGFLHSSTQREWAHLLTAFHQGLKEAGFVEGQTVTMMYRWAEGQFDRLPGMAADLMGGKPDLIVTGGGAVAALAAKRATSTIPIVVMVGADPVKLGLVASLNRPGGNLTGVSYLFNALVAKRLDFLRAFAPSTGAIGMLVNPANPNAQGDIAEVQDAARTLGLASHVGNAGRESEIDTAFDALRQQGAGALIVLPDPYFLDRRNQIVALAARHSMPAIYFVREFAAAGGLMSYSASLTEAYGLAGSYTGRILKGEKPADLPVVQPTKFELVINLKTAKALGLEVPDRLLALADEVIE